MNMETLISVENVSRFYADHCAVDNISFTVNRGEVLGFLGPNGAGKTTTMQLICGVLTASRGAINIAGHDIIESPKQAKRHIGFLPEHPPLYPELSVDEYLAYAGRLRNINTEQLTGAVNKCKSRCGLVGIGHRLIKNLSKGYQQRVGIAQAIIHSPSIVILDEPTSGLDPIQIREIRQLIRELGGEHSVILSTHILPEVQTICDRVLIIHEGKLVMDQYLKELQQQDNDQQVRLAFRQPPDIGSIESVEGVHEVRPVDNREFIVTLALDSCAIDNLLQKSINDGWGLIRLVPESGTLEDMFIQLTQKDIQPPEQVVTVESE